MILKRRLDCLRQDRRMKVGRMCSWEWAILDELIQKFVDEKYKSGITESNYIEIHSKPNEEYLSQKDVKEMHDKGVYLLKI